MSQLATAPIAEQAGTEERLAPSAGPASGAPSAPPDAGNRAKVFISYSRKDAGFAEALVGALTDRGFDAFLDKTDIAPGEPWKERLAALIGAADTVVFVVSPDSAASEICAWELEESARLGKRVIPIVARRVADAQAPSSLRRLNWIFCAEGDDREAALSALDQALHTDLAWVREHTRLGELAQRWQDRGRAKGATLRGTDLEAAERWLDRRPADANAPTALHQDFIRASRRAATARQRTTVGGAILVALVALALAAFAEVSRRDAQHQRRQAELQRAAAETARGEAQTQRDRAETALKEAQTQRDRAERTLALATKTTNDLIVDLAVKFSRAIGVPTATVKSILDRTRELQEQLVSSGEVSPDLRESQAIAADVTSATFLTLGLTDDALKSAQKALEIMLDLLKADPGSERWRHGVAVSNLTIGDVLRTQGKFPEALKIYGDALASFQELAAAEPDDLFAQRDVAIASERLGFVQSRLGSLQDALKSFQASLAVRQRLAGAQPDDTDWQRDLSLAYNKIGDIERALGHPDEALEPYSSSLAIMERLTKSDPGNAQWQRDLSLSNDYVGYVEEDHRNFAAALEHFETSLAIRQKLATADPDNVEAQHDLAISYSSIGHAQLWQDDFDGAIATYQAGIEVLTRLTKIDADNLAWPLELARFYRNLMVSYGYEGKLSEARQALETGRSILARLLEAHPDMTDVKQELDFFDSKLQALKQ
ncbi:MAG: TIR domain-containing protein [Hyphomicrobiales bacterium]